MRKFIVKSILLLPLSLLLFLSLTFEGVVEAPIRNRICESRAEAGKEWVDAVDRELNCLPENLLAAFLEDGWHLYVTTEDLAGTYFPDSPDFNVRGVTLRTERMILINASEDAVSEAVGHEFGHYLDARCKMPSESEEFLKIYREEAPLFRRGRTATLVDSPGEFFAETFQCLRKDPERCTPKAAAFVKHYMDGI